LEGRDEYELSDLDKVIDAIKWDLPERNKAKHASLDDVLLRANELGIEYHPVGLKGDILVSNFDDGLEVSDKTFQYSTVEKDDIVLFESLYDVFESNKGIYLNELPEDSKKEILDRLFDSFFAENDQMVVVYDKQEVPSYALGALINGDFSGIEDPDDEQNIRDFMDEKGGYVIDVDPDSVGFSRNPAFGLPTDCETAFFVKPITPKELLEQQKIGTNKELESAKEVKVDPELREARGYLMDVISHALSQMNGHVEIEHTELPSVLMKGDFWKKEGGNVYMELIKGEHNVKDAMFHDVHAETYTLDEVINKLDYSETYALTIAVREAQIANLIGGGKEITFNGGFAVSQDGQSVDKDYIDRVEVDEDGKLNIVGHGINAQGNDVSFDHGEGMYLDGFDELYAKVNEMRQQENAKLRALLGEVIGSHGQSIEIRPTEIDSHTKVLFLMNNNSTILYDGQKDGNPVTNHILDIDKLSIASIQSLRESIDNAQEMLVGDEINQNEGKDEFLNYVVYGERRYPIYQNMENRLNAFMKNSGVDIPLSHILYGENTKVNRWSDLHQIASRAVESILRESGQGDEKLLNSTTTDYVSDKAKTLALDIVRSIRVDEVNYEARREEALKAIGYPYLKHTTNADGSFNIPTVDESLYWEYAAGVISLKDAAREFNRSGWTNFVDEKYTKAKFAQLNEQFGKLDADLKPLLAQQKELGEAKENLMNTLNSARTDLGDTILIKPTPVKLAGNAFAKATGVFLAPDGKGGGEFRLAGEYYAVLAVESDGHTEFDVTKILDNASSVNALTKAVHDAHVINLEQKSKQAIRDRIVTPSARSFTPNQVDALNRYQQIATPETPAREVFARLLHEVSQEPDVAQKSEKWIIDTAKELDEVAKGNTREDNQQLKR
jgi:hypothetical protein